MKIIHGNSLDILKTLDESSVDAVVTDPPYGLSFMNKKWDYDVPSKELWVEVLRVLKPGGHLLSFGGTRTYHRMVVNIEDAGFEIRDQVQWLYGSGFPKSHDVSKAIDNQAGVIRPLVSQVRADGTTRDSANPGATCWKNTSKKVGQTPICEDSTDEAKQWQGWGTALKPANEPICLARKPLEKGLTIAQNVLKYGTGALNIDASRIESEPVPCQVSSTGSGFNKYDSKDYPGKRVYQSQGRWPANILLDEQAAAVLDEQSGILKQGIAGNNSSSFGDGKIFGTAKEFKPNNSTTYACDVPSGASRFFYVAKASKSERNAGLEGMPKVKRNITQGHGRGAINTSKADGTGIRENRPSENFHPTVKPIKLMEYLIKLITPPNGIVLDPFAGSGSTGVACKKLGFEFVGIELQLEYVEIAKKRIERQLIELEPSAIADDSNQIKFSF